MRRLTAIVSPAATARSAVRVAGLAAVAVMAALGTAAGAGAVPPDNIGTIAQRCTDAGGSYTEHIIGHSCCFDARDFGPDNCLYCATETGPCWWYRPNVVLAAQGPIRPTTATLAAA